MVSDNMAKLYLFSIQGQIEYSPDCPLFMPRAPTQEELYDEGPPHIELGTVQERPDVRYGFRLDQPGHTLIFAGTGFGKTSLLRLLAKRIYDYDRQEENQSDTL